MKIDQTTVVSVIAALAVVGLIFRYAGNLPIVADIKAGWMGA